MGILGSQKAAEPRHGGRAPPLPPPIGRPWRRAFGLSRRITVFGTRFGRTRMDAGRRRAAFKATFDRVLHVLGIGRHVMVDDL